MKTAATLKNQNHGTGAASRRPETDTATITLHTAGEESGVASGTTTARGRGLSTERVKEEELVVRHRGRKVEGQAAIKHM